MTTQRRFFLTGAASGIGRHLTGRLSSEGHIVWATDLELDALADAASQDGWPAERVHHAALDVRDSDAWQRVFADAVAELERIDVLMNVAGVLDADWVRNPRPDLVHLHIDVNLKGVIFGTQQAATHMVERGSGHIVNVASMAGRVPLPGLALYCATKFGVRAYSVAAAGELRGAGVAVTVVCPDAVSTPMVDRQRHMESAAITFSSSRMLTVEDVGNVILGRVLQKQPIECFIPRAISWMAWLSDSFPFIGLKMAPAFARKGEANRNRQT